MALPESLEKRLAKKPLLRELVELLFILEDAPGAREFLQERYKKIMKEVKKLPPADKSPGPIVITPKLRDEDFIGSGLIRINWSGGGGIATCDNLLTSYKNKLIALEGKIYYRLLITQKEFEEIRRNIEQARIPVSSPLKENDFDHFTLEDGLRSADKIRDEIAGIFEKYKVDFGRVNTVYKAARSVYAAAQGTLRPDRRLYYHTLLHAVETALFVARGLSHRGVGRRQYPPTGGNCLVGP